MGDIIDLKAKIEEKRQQNKNKENIKIFENILKRIFHLTKKRRRTSSRRIIAEKRFIR